MVHGSVAGDICRQRRRIPITGVSWSTLKKTRDRMMVGEEKNILSCRLSHCAWFIYCIRAHGCAFVPFSSSPDSFPLLRKEKEQFLFAIRRDDERPVSAATLALGFISLDIRMSRRDLQVASVIAKKRTVQNDPLLDIENAEVEVWTTAAILRTRE